MTILIAAYYDGPGPGMPDSGSSGSAPRIRPADAAELCAEPYPTRREAIAVARQLRSAGWVVIEHSDHPPRRPDGLVMVASVYHPTTYESPGDLLAPGDVPR